MVIPFINEFAEQTLVFPKTLLQAETSKNRPINDAFLQMVDPPRKEEKLVFTSMPTVSGDSVASLYQSYDIPRRTEPLRIWTGTGARQFSLTVKFVASQNARIDVINPINFMRALQYPISRFSGSKFNRPPIMLLVMGSWLRVRCIAMQTSVDWITDAVSTDGSQPMEAQVTTLFEMHKRDSINGEYTFDRIKAGQADSRSTIEEAVDLGTEILERANNRRINRGG